MHDHNLDDLIIDNIEPKNTKTKSFLTIIALMIVVLIVAIILTKILLKTPHEGGLAFEENATEMIAPELRLKEEPTLSSTTNESIKTPVDPVSKKENIKLETDKNELLSNIDHQEIKAPEIQTEKSVAEKEAKDAADIAYWKAIQEKRKAEKIAYEAKRLEKPIVLTKEENTEKVVKPQTIKTVKPVVTSLKKSVTKTVAAKSTPKTFSTGRYYVQVGAYRKQPSTRFISVIQNNGYKYIMTKPDRNGIKRLLIGPYKNRESVNRVLIDVKDRIHKRAFIIAR